MQKFEKSSNTSVVVSLPESLPASLSVGSETSIPVTVPFNFPLQFTSMKAQILSETDAGKSAFIRALMHANDGAMPASEADFEKAHAHFSEAISLTQNLDESEALGGVYGFRGFVGLMWNTINNERPLEHVMSDFKKSGALLPIEETYILLGHTYWQLDASEDALQSLEKAIELNPLCAEAYMLKGLFHQERGEKDLAHEDIYWAISLNPDLYDERFEPIMQAEREAENAWSELQKQPEFQAHIQEQMRKLRCRQQ